MVVLFNIIQIRIHKKMMKKKNNFKLNGEKGQSLVELSLSLILLLIILSGIVDLGRAIFTKFAMKDAAEEGVIYGTSFPTDCNQINQRVEFNLSNRALNGGMTIVTTIEGNGGNFIECSLIPYNQVYAGKKLKVTVTKTFTVTMPFLGAFIGQTIPLSVTANGIVLRPQPQNN